MSKVIAVWGNAGAGKSTISALLAYQLSTQGKNVVLIDTNLNTPQTNIWLPKSSGDFNRSLSSLMNEDYITKETVCQRMFMINSNLSILGFVRGESAITLNKNQRTDKIDEILEVLDSISDYIIVDCSTHILDNAITIKALELAYRTFRILSPNFKGCVFTQSNLQLLSNNKFRVGEHIVLYNNVCSYHNTKIYEEVTGKALAHLPHCPDIDIKNCNGQIFTTAVSKSAKEYMRMLMLAVEMQKGG